MTLSCYYDVLCRAQGLTERVCTMQN